MPVAASGPLFVTVTVKVVFWPKTGVTGLIDLLTARSADCAVSSSTTWA